MVRKIKAGHYAVDTDADRYDIFHRSQSREWVVYSENAGGTVAHAASLQIAVQFIGNREATR